MNTQKFVAPATVSLIILMPFGSRTENTIDSLLNLAERVNSAKEI